MGGLNQRGGRGKTRVNQAHKASPRCGKSVSEPLLRTRRSFSTADIWPGPTTQGAGREPALPVASY